MMHLVIKLCKIAAVWLALLTVNSLEAYQATEQPTAPPAIAIAKSEGIIIYGVTWRNELEEIGRLPPEFALFDFETSTDWLINPVGNFVISPDQLKIAFTAQQQDEQATGLFIYDLLVKSLDHSVVITDCGDLYPPQIIWSPNSLAIQTSVCNQSLIYSLDDAQNIALPSDYVWGYWSSDSLLIYHNTSSGIGLWDSKTTLSSSLASIDELMVSPSVGIYPFWCQFVWSEPIQRWFFEVGCVETKDWPFDYLYSIDLEGKIYLETSLPDFYAARLPQTATKGSYTYVDVHSIIPSEAGLYMVVELGVDSNYYHSVMTYEDSWGNHMRPNEIFQVSGAYGLNQIAVSPDKKLVALVDFGGTINIVALPSGQLHGQILGGMFDNIGDSYRIRWLDQSRFIYRRTDDGIGIFYTGVYDRVDINLVAEVDEPSIILR